MTGETWLGPQLLPSTPTGQYGALVGASKRSKMDGSDFMIEMENPAVDNYSN